MANNAVKDPNWPELTKVEVEICKENFIFWDKLRQGYIDRPLLRMFLKGTNQPPTAARPARQIGPLLPISPCP